MKLTPVLTEKSLIDAKEGHFTFKVNRNLTKVDIKRVIEKAFDVHVTSVRTANSIARTKKNNRGKRSAIKAYKKAWVKLGDKESIDIFEEKTK
jgi:large subunit ribosomal protein L23